MAVPTGQVIDVLGKVFFFKKKKIHPVSGIDYENGLGHVQ